MQVEEGEERRALNQRKTGMGRRVLMDNCTFAVARSFVSFFLLFRYLSHTHLLPPPTDRGFSLAVFINSLGLFPLTSMSSMRGNPPSSSAQS